MSEKKLKIVKGSLTQSSRGEAAEAVELSPAEQAEVARFKAMTAERAAKQATVQRLIAKLREKGRFSNAA